jgi:hypothetical protein
MDTLHRSPNDLSVVTELASRIADHPSLWLRPDDVRARTARALIENAEQTGISTIADRRWLGRVQQHLERLLLELDTEMLEA